MWYTLVVGALVVAFAIGSYYIIARVLAGRADRFLADANSALYEEVRKETNAGDDAVTVIRNALVDYRFREIVFLAFDGTALLARSPAARGSAALAAEAGPPLDLERLAGDLDQHAQNVPFTLGDAEGGFRVTIRHLAIGATDYSLVAAQSWHGYAETLELIAWGYVIVVPFLLLLAAAGGYWLAAYSLAPVSAMGEKAASIGRKNLHERLVVANADDELGRLAAVFNDLLSRLGGAFDQQQRFMQEASHELRTPVSIIRAEADVALSQPMRSEREYRGALAVVHNASLRLSRIVEDLFFLARADADQPIIERARLDLGEVVQSAARALRHRAADAAVRVLVHESPECPIVGDFVQLERVLLNLLDNSLKNTPAGGTIEMRLTPLPGSYAIRVVDTGVGIDADAQSQIFDRFFRLAPSVPGRTVSRMTGSGLGLPIARAIAESHGGRLELTRSDTTGSEFTLWLPVPCTEGAGLDVG